MKLLCSKAPLHISVGRFDERRQRRAIDVAVGSELDVAHVLARTFQQARWIREVGAAEESDIDMGFERVDVGEGGVGHASRRVAVMQQFAYIISTNTDDAEPVLRD